ncbi:leucine rich repeat-containing protein, putative [Babesia ovis]|uniref:Leucine rich repeat-containing protein, putative n=1 Tax=Babesia ovis TaxID=5869 RepID=A0A9W5T8E5_BABOV|nr:leucine rich repeat-containing protein, putative [Babesia ovis]
MCSSITDVAASRRRALAKDKTRAKEYLFGVISQDDVEWAKNALDTGAQVKRQAFNEQDQDRASTVDSETVQLLDDSADVCVRGEHTSMKDLIENVQQLSLKLGAEGRQRESLELQITQLREQNSQLVAKLNNVESYKRDSDAYTSALSAIKQIDVQSYGQNCEQIMDAIYTAICDAFGPDNNLALLFEEMADIYLKTESKHELEVQAMQKQIDFLTQFENVIKGEVQPNVKTLDALVEQLKNTKEEAAAEIAELQNQREALLQENQLLKMQNKAMAKEFEAEREELNVKASVHQDRYQQMMRDQAQLLSQLPLLKMSPTNQPIEDGVLRQTGKSTLESLVSALYRKDAETQKLLKRKDETIQQQQAKINKLEARVKEWEADAILWLDYVNQSNARNKIGN